MYNIANITHIWFMTINLLTNHVINIHVINYYNIYPYIKYILNTFNYNIYNKFNQSPFKCLLIYINIFLFIYSFSLPVVNLSIADAMVSSLNVTFNYIYMLDNDWPFGELYCKISQFIATLSISASVFTLMAISIDR